MNTNNKITAYRNYWSCSRYNTNNAWNFNGNNGNLNNNNNFTNTNGVVPVSN